MSQLDAVLADIDAHLEGSLERLFQLIRIPSISTDPAYAAACRQAADWVVEDLRAIGFEATAHQTGGHPVVVGHDRARPGPSALFYGHYDVQPVDPLDLWDADPFEPSIVTLPDGRKVIRARGACDDKGQVMTFLAACRAWKAVAGHLPIGVTVMIEGEEESGGEHLPAFVEARKEELKADIGLVCDTSLFDRHTPAITTMLRGLCGEEVIITAADRDLHSGAFGSAAANPNHVLARILADLHDESGRVTLPGFYDGVPDLPKTIREQWSKLNWSDEAFLGQVGLKHPAGERGYNAMEQTWSRPTCEINGMGGGYQGAGFKTVIPAKASAKVSFRLVFDQDPKAIRAAFRDFVKARVPADCSVEFIDHGEGHAVAFPTDRPEFEKARKALSEEWGAEAAFIGCGGSIPVTREFRDVLGMDVILAGFGNDDDRVHSPNEKYDLESFRKGTRAWARILHALAT